jgi:hypothetical protein
MQPYFFPYIGYFQLIAAVDLFIVHDRVKYTKKGWINRNRFLQDGRDALMSLPLKAGSDALDIVERELAPDFRRDKLLNRIGEAYRKAPHFDSVFALVRRVLMFDDSNLFRFLWHSIEQTCRHLGIATPMVPASALYADPALAGADRVIALCRAAGATRYVNPIGGVELYGGAAFRAQGIDLRFLRAKPFEYPQLGAPFVPWLSIVDVMMFNPVAEVRERVASAYELRAAA